MFKIILFFNFLFIIINMKKKYWMMQNLIIFMIFIILFFLNNMKNYFSMISMFVGCDILSFGLIMLTLWISFLMLMASEQIYKFNNFLNFFNFNILLLLILLLLTFLSMNLFLFYMFFEGSLIPTLILILGWGYQPERLQAGIYLLFYTLFVSLPMLIGIFFVQEKISSMIFYFFTEFDFNLIMLYLCLILAFLVKMPMFLIHLWLPKAHVEAPISGSMILAGIMLKLGGYGMIRVMNLFETMNLSVNYYLMSISLFGGMLVSFICLRQIDLKSLIAYSSVAHMSLVLGGILTMNYWGMLGAYILMIAHGLCSSGLFCLANFSYERISSRSLLINKGLLNLMPSLALWWFLLCSFNMAAPPSLNLLGEIFLLNSIISWSMFSMIILSVLSFFSAAYTLYLFTFSQHGKFFFGIYSFSSSKIREFMILLLHWFPLNLLILEDNIFNFIL